MEREVLIFMWTNGSKIRVSAFSLYNEVIVRYLVVNILTLNVDQNLK